MPDAARIITRIASSWLLPAGALGVLLLANALFTPRFFELTIVDGNIQGVTFDILTRGAILVIVALGMTLVIATGGVDLSVGAVVAIAGATAAVTVNSGYHALIAISLALAISTGAGLFNGVLVAGARVQPIVATLVLMVAGRGVAQLITQGQNVTFDAPMLAFLDSGRIIGIPMPILLALLTLLSVGALTRLTALGLFIEATGDNESASRLAGVRTRFVTLLTYAMCAAGAGLAGILVAADIGTADANTAGLYLELDAILAVVLGGTPLVGGRFTLIGTVLGALFIQTLSTTLLLHDVNPNLTLVVKAIVVIGVCLLLSDRVREIARALVRREARA